MGYKEPYGFVSEAFRAWQIVMIATLPHRNKGKIDFIL
jgi:hypothetical protein